MHTIANTCLSILFSPVNLAWVLCWCGSHVLGVCDTQAEAWDRAADLCEGEQREYCLRRARAVRDGYKRFMH